MSATEWRDSSGKRLVDYPRPSVAVDVAVLTVLPREEPATRSTTPEPDGLGVVLHRRESGEWALPGTFLHEGERLADAVVRVLRDKCGIEGVTPHQLHVFDDPTRDPRGWVLSVAHAVVVPHDRVSALPDDVAARPLHDAHPARGRHPWQTSPSTTRRL